MKRRVPWFPVIAAAIIVACAEAPIAPLGPEGPGGDGLKGPVNLLTPASGALIVQNDPSIACVDHPTRGKGFRLDFDWEDVEGAYAYAIHLQRVGAMYPAVDWRVVNSEFELDWCNTFVIDANLTNWVWRVAAIGMGPDSTAADTLWSDAREYGFTPCRLASGGPCYATAEVDTLPPPPGDADD
jgi:hypothetical protein